MQFYPNSLGDDKVLADSGDDLSETIRGQRRCPAAKVETGYFFFARIPASDQMNLLQESIQIAVAGFPIVQDFAVGTETADVLTKRNMNIQTERIAVSVRQFTVIFILKKKRFCRTCQPHPCKICNDTHNTVRCAFRCFSIRLNIF